jgi:hypothetical protein
MATAAQKYVVLLAFVAAALSFAAVAITFVRSGRLELTPLAGGLLMLVLGAAGLSRIRNPRT